MGGTGHLMSAEAIKDITLLSYKVVPVTWMEFCGTRVPMEFAAVPTRYVLFVMQFLVLCLWLTPLGSWGQFKHSNSLCAVHP